LSSSHINRSVIDETVSHSYHWDSLFFKSDCISFFDCQIVELIDSICTKIIESAFVSCFWIDYQISIASISKYAVSISTIFCKFIIKFCSPVITTRIKAIRHIKCIVQNLRIARTIHLTQSCLNSIQQSFWNIYWNSCSTCEWLWCVSHLFRRSSIIHHTFFISSRQSQCVCADSRNQNNFSCSCFSFCIQLFDCCDHSLREQRSFSTLDCNTCCTARQIWCKFWKNYIVCRHCSRVQIIHCKPDCVWVQAICRHYEVLQVSKEIGLSETHWTHQLLSVNSRWSNSYHHIVGAQTFVGESLYKRTLHHWSVFHRLSTHCRDVMNHHHLQ